MSRLGCAVYLCMGLLGHALGDDGLVAALQHKNANVLPTETADQLKVEIPRAV